MLDSSTCRHLIETRDNVISGSGSVSGFRFLREQRRPQVSWNVFSLPVSDLPVTGRRWARRPLVGAGSGRGAAVEPARVRFGVRRGGGGEFETDALVPPGPGIRSLVSGGKGWHRGSWGRFLGLWSNVPVAEEAGSPFWTLGALALIQSTIKPYMKCCESLPSEGSALSLTEQFLLVVFAT